MKKQQFIARIIAIVLALMIFVLLLLFYVRKELSQSGIGASKIAPKELVGIAYFRSMDG